MNGPIWYESITPSLRAWLGGVLTTIQINASSMISGILSTLNGGTGLDTYTQGDIVYYNSGTTFNKLAKDTNSTRYLSNQGTSNNPSWNQVNLSNGVTGTLTVSNGGTGTSTAFTAGSVIFAGASGVYSQDNTNLFWNDTTNRLGIGQTTPRDSLDITFTDITAGFVGIRLQNLGSSGSPFSGMLITNHSGATGIFQGFNNLTAEFRTNNVAVSGTLNWLIGSVSRLFIHNSGGVSFSNSTDPGAGSVRIAGSYYTQTGTFLMRSTAAFTNGAGAGAGTLLNSPANGNPTKWIPVDDNGTTRYIPAW